MSESEIKVKHEHHADSPGDVYITIGSWPASAGELVVFARDEYTTCTATTVVDITGDGHEERFASGIEAVLKSHFRTLRDETIPDLGHSLAEPWPEPEPAPEATTAVDWPNRQAVTYHPDGTVTRNPLHPTFIAWMTEKKEI